MKTIFEKSLFILSFLLLSTSYSFAFDHPEFENFDDKGEALVDEARTLQVGKPGKLGIKIHTRNFNNKDLAKLYKATQILEKVINSEELKELILHFRHGNDQMFFQNKGMSNKEIYKHLMTGAEDIRPELDHVMDFDLTMYRSWNPWSKVKGYTKPGTLRIWIHSKYYRRNSWTAVDVAANMAHEWVHKMGFTHDYYYNQDRPYSVPYAIGGLVKSVAEKMMQN